MQLFLQALGWHAAVVVEPESGLVVQAPAELQAPPLFVQSVQDPPPAPHEVTLAPPEHTPAAVQQPGHDAGPQGGGESMSTSAGM
jgi:hypothetical protein